jgi:4-alpha-glucanotransferase
LFRGEPLFTRQPAVLNVLYIDLDAVSEFAGLKTAEMEETIDRLRRQDLFDYLGVRTVKWHALVKAYKTFFRTPQVQAGAKERACLQLRRQRDLPM